MALDVESVVPAEWIERNFCAEPALAPAVGSADANSRPDCLLLAALMQVLDAEIAGPPGRMTASRRSPTAPGRRHTSSVACASV